MSLKQTLLALIACFLLMVAEIPQFPTPGERGPDIPASKTHRISTPTPIRYLTLLQYNLICQVPGYRYSGTDHFEHPVSHIEELKGNATLGHQPGGGWCWRYSCEYNQAIYACNDNDHEIEVPWATMVQYARRIHNACSFEWENQNGFLMYRVLGQAFHPAGWKLIVGIDIHKGC